MRPRRTLVWLAPIVALSVLSGPAHAAGGTTYTWVGNSNSSGGDNHSWSDQLNWNPVGQPGDGDSVVIEQPSANDCFAHVDAVPTVSLDNFTLLQNPGLCTTSITGGAITVEGTFLWNGGTLDTPTTVSSTGTITGSNAEQSTLAADLDVTGSVTRLTGLTGQGALTIDAGSVLSVEGGASLESSGANTIAGSACCTTPAKIHNLGTVAVDGGTLTLSALQFDQWATVATSSHGELVTIAGPITTDSAGNYTGDGAWRVEDHSAARFAGTQTLGHDFVLDYGGLTSTFSSTLSGTTTLDGTGTFSWTGGVIEAALTIAHGVTMSVEGAHSGGAGRVLEGLDTSGDGPVVPVTQTNHGTITVGSHAVVTTAGSAHLVNASEGVLTLAPGTGLSAQGCCTSPDRLVNAGTVSALPGTGPTVALTGIAYQSTGTTSVAAARTLALTGGAPGSLSSGRLTGGGKLSIAGPTAVSGTITLAGHTTVQLAAHGSLDGGARFAGSGSLRWVGGALSGRPVFAPAGGIVVAGADTKTVANVGGGSTPSLVRFTVPTGFAAGTSHVHDVIVLGSSRLLLAAPTTVGRFTEFDDGVLENDSALSIGSASVPIRNYTQTRTGSLLLDDVSGAHGAVHSIGSVSLRGTIRVHNGVRPPARASLIVATAQTLSGSPSCVATTGTGAATGHWAASQTGTRLVLHWRRGASPRC